VGAAEILAATQDSCWPEAVARSKGTFLTAVEPVAEPADPDPPPATESRPQARAQLIVRHHTEQIAAVPLAEGVLGIGRSPDNGLCLDARYVSRRHCRVVTMGSRSTIEDLGSINGIAVNGIAVRKHVLRHADEITIGEHLLTYVVE
jgi:hypothetical protein